MKQILAPVVAGFVLCSGAMAQDTPDPDAGTSLMEDGARLFMRGLMDEMGPMLQQLEGLGEEVDPLLRALRSEVGPALLGLLDTVEDWSVYEAPERLPNGDILIRRKEPLQPEETPEQIAPPEPGEAIDL